MCPKPSNINKMRYNINQEINNNYVLQYVQVNVKGDNNKIKG